MKLGIDRLFEDKKVKLRGRRIGVLCHSASVNSKLVHLLNLLHPKVQLTQLFGPEHGIWGVAQDMESVEFQKEPLTGLPVVSLYGKNFESLAPKKEHLENIDVLICDLQDIGCRYYTYAATLFLCLEACAKLGKEIILLDRPNPLNGQSIEGPLLTKGFESFVGLYSVPIRHGKTLGELALAYQKDFHLDLELTVVKASGWSRDQYADETSLPWIPPSPNMPTLDTALVYPGMCLLEATNLSEGRGTTRPFEWVGAPFIDPDLLKKEMDRLKLSGVFFRPIWFKPTFQKWAHQVCGGVQVHVVNRRKFQSLFTGIQLLKTIRHLYPHDFQWRNQPYEFVSKIPAIDLLYGSDRLRKCLEENQSVEDLREEWKKFTKPRGLIYT